MKLAFPEIPSFDHNASGFFLAQRKGLAVYFYIPATAKGGFAHQFHKTAGQNADRHEFTACGIVAESLDYPFFACLQADESLV